MDASKIRDAVGTITEAADSLGSIDDRKAVELSMMCTMASTVLIEIAHHMQGGMDFSQACLAAAKGEMKIAT